METPLAAPMVIKVRADSEVSTAFESRRSSWETLPEEPAFVGAWQPSALDAQLSVPPPPPGLGRPRCRSYSDALMGTQSMKPERQRSESDISTSEGSETVSDSGERATEEPLFIGEQPWQSEQAASAEPLHVAVPPPPPPPPGLAEQFGSLPGSGEVEASVGSMNHPHHCGQPCKYMRRKGGCRNGADCLDCHICQWQRDRREMEEHRRECWSVGTQGHPYACKNACRYVRRKSGCRNGAFCDSCHLCMWRRGQDDEEETYLPQGFDMQDMQQGFVEFVPVQPYVDERRCIGRVQQRIQFCPWWQGNC